MAQIQIEVLALGTTVIELRLHNATQEEGTRRVVDVTALLEQVQASAANLSAASAPQRRHLAQTLYDWLDGPAHWLRQAAPASVELILDSELDALGLPWELLMPGSSVLRDDPERAALRSVRRRGPVAPAPRARGDSNEGNSDEDSACDGDSNEGDSNE